MHVIWFLLCIAINMYVMLRQTAEYKINSKNILQHFVKLEATQHTHTITSTCGIFTFNTQWL